MVNKRAKTTDTTNQPKDTASSAAVENTVATAPEDSKKKGFKLSISTEIGAQGLFGKYPYDVTLALTQNRLQERINRALEHVDFGVRYYWITSTISDKELHSPKWKTYLFLRRCVLEYRDGRQDELLEVLKFLENRKNKTWLAARLLDPAEKDGEEKWGSGKHEWLERCLIVDVLKRSAGMIKDIEAETDFGCIAGEIDWLYIQAMVRTPTKYILFKNEQITIQEGHCGAVKPDLEKRGFSSKGSPAFHEKLIESFEESKTIAGFLKRIRNIFREELYSGKKPINASANTRYIVNGAKTSDRETVSQFRKEILKPKGYIEFIEMISALIEFASTNYTDENPGETIAEVLSESSEDTASETEDNILSEDDIWDDNHEEQSNAKTTCKPG